MEIRRLWVKNYKSLRDIIESGLLEAA